VALSDVRKEISFCQKTSLPIIGVVENMSMFVCPHCKCESDIFAASSGGAAKMCKDFNLDLLAQIPLDPIIVKNCDNGLYIGENYKDSKVFKEYEKFAESKILKKIIHNLYFSLGILSNLKV
jgi:NUBPL iron-transfer P-loop NTPase